MLGSCSVSTMETVHSVCLQYRGARINLLILLRSLLDEWFYYCVSACSFFYLPKTSLEETVRSSQHLSTCQPHWPADISFCNSISHRKCGDLLQPAAFCHSVAWGVVKPSESRGNCVLLLSHGSVSLNAAARGNGCSGAGRESLRCLWEMEPVFYQSPLEGTGVQCECVPVFVSLSLCVCLAWAVTLISMSEC